MASATISVLAAAGSSLFNALRDRLAEQGRQKTLDDLPIESRKAVEQALADLALVLTGLVSESDLPAQTRKHLTFQRRALRRIVGADAISRASEAAANWLQGAGG